MTLPVEGFLNLDQQTPPNPSDDPSQYKWKLPRGWGVRLPGDKSQCPEWTAA